MTEKQSNMNWSVGDTIHSIDFSLHGMACKIDTLHIH